MTSQFNQGESARYGKEIRDPFRLKINSQTHEHCCTANEEMTKEKCQNRKREKPKLNLNNNTKKKKRNKNLIIQFYIILTSPRN